MKKILFLAALICVGVAGSAQNTEEEKIKKVILQETESFYSRNLEGWRTTWAHNPKVSRTIIANNYHFHQTGWDSTNAQMERTFKNFPTPEEVKLENKNFNIVQQGNMAWVYYDQSVKSSDVNAIPIEWSKEFRVLVKEGDDWKLIGQVTTLPESFDLSKPFAMENNLNTAGYALLQANKTAEAIDLFKLNVKLYPASWNTYDSLAEAYEKAGNKKLAMENYEKSVKLNPKNDHGVKALAKLKTQ